MKNITKFLLEVSENDYFIDLLFYHLRVRSYVVIELKAGKYNSEDAGKLNFYLSAIDSQLKKTIKVMEFYCVKRKTKLKPNTHLGILISEYKLTDAIPETMRTKLPSVEELENELTEKMDKTSR